MFGLAGAHRSGKTTLARALADKLEVEFLETKVSEIFTDLRVDPKADLPFHERLDVQNAILRSLERQYALRNGKPFICDRTPFDVLGYTMADIRRDTLDDTLRDRVRAHIGIAEQIAGEYLRGVMLVRPLIGQVDAPGKAQACPLYMHHVYTMVKQMLETCAPYLMGKGFVSVEALSLDHAERMEDGAEFFTMLNEVYGEPEPKIWMPNS